MPLSRLAPTIPRLLAAPAPVSTRCSQSKIIPEPRFSHHPNGGLSKLLRVMTDISQAPAVGFDLPAAGFGAAAKNRFGFPRSPDIDELVHSQSRAANSINRQI